MKISKILWWIVTIFWSGLFAIATAFVWLRKIDGTGAVQTYEAKLISFIIVLIIFIFPAIIQLIWLITNIVVSKNSKEN